MYEELGGDPPKVPSGSEWVDPLIEQGWVDVTPKVSGDPSASFSSPTTRRGKLRHAVDHAILREKSGEKSEWEDTALAGLADRVLSNAQAAQVTIHTTDRPAQKGSIECLRRSGPGTFEPTSTTHTSRRHGSETRGTSAGSE